MAKFSKGPWRVSVDCAYDVFCGYSVTIPYKGKITKTLENKEDAYLIAAAPDLYEALKGSCKGCEERECNGEDCYIYQVIKKAEGGGSDG